MWAKQLLAAVVCACALVSSASGAIIGIDFSPVMEDVFFRPTPLNWTPIGTEDGSDISVSGLTDETGFVTAVGVSVTGFAAPPPITLFSPNASSIPTHTPSLAALDDYANGTALTVTFDGLVPNATYRYWIFGLRASPYTNTVDVIGATSTSVSQTGGAGDLTVNSFAPTTAVLSSLALSIDASSAGTITFANDPGTGTVQVSGRFAGFAIERVEVVPEPATILVWGILVAMGGLFTLRSRVRR